MQVQYKVGDLYLIGVPYMKEVEIQDVSQTANAVKYEGYWYDAKVFHENCRGKLGRVEYRRGFLGTKRVVIRS